MKAKNVKLLDKIYSELEDLKSRLEAIRDDEQDAYDNKSENWQNGEKGEAASQAIDHVTSAADALGDVLSHIEEAKTSN